MWRPQSLLTLILMAVGTASASVQTPKPNEFWQAIDDGNADMVKALVVRGANPNVKIGDRGYTPLMVAAQPFRKISKLPVSTFGTISLRVAIASQIYRTPCSGTTRWKSSL